MNLLPVGRPAYGLGQVYIPETQRRVHETTETFAVLVAAPFSLWLATRRELPPWARLLSAAIGVGTFVVDGGLLLAWNRR